MLEIILVLSLLGNGFLLKEQGELGQNNKQLQQVVVEQESLIGERYHEIGKLEEKLVEVERNREAIFTKSEERAVELEKLRNTSVVVNNYLNQTIPSGVVEHLQTYREDGVHSK